jgi:hypothetical protein
MRKIFFLIALAFLGFRFADAQELGVRFGNVVGNYAALDLAWGFKSGRIHADASFGDGVGAEALYDFLFGRLGDDNLYYYVGLGAFAWIGDPFGLGASFEAGLEYRFRSAPLALGLDWRPAFQILDEPGFYVDRFGLNLRFVF